MAGQFNGKMEVEARFHWFEGTKSWEIINVDSVKRCDLKGRREMKWSPQGHKFEGGKCFSVKIFSDGSAFRIIIYYRKGEA